MKVPLPEKDFYIDITTNPSRKTETKTHVHHHIRDILQKQTFVVFNTDTKGVIESHVNNYLRDDLKTTTDPPPG